MKNILKIVIILLVLASLVFVAFRNGYFSNGESSGDVVSEEDLNKYPDDYSERECVCLERDRPACKDGSWTLNEAGTLCRKNDLITSVLFWCSKYHCIDKVYVFNSTENEWRLE